MKILVTLDGSQRSEAILPSVEAVARGCGAEIHLMTVVHTPTAEGRARRRVVDPQYPTAFGGSLGVASQTIIRGRVQTVPVETKSQAIERLEHEADEYLQSVEKRLRGLSITRVVKMSDAPEKPILTYARKLKPDLIAMATHGRTGLAAVLQGSVARAIVKAQVAPVLLVRPKNLRERKGK